MPTCLNFTLYCDNGFPSNWWRNDVRDLSQICQEFAGAHYSIDIVHFADERRRATHDGVVKAPAVLLEREDGSRQNLGSFKEAREYLRLMSLAKITPGTAPKRPVVS